MTSEYKISILIPSIESRMDMLIDLVRWLRAQIGDKPVELLVNSTPVISIGEKRNTLLDSAKGEYVCFIDDDDMVSGSYVDTLLKAIESSPDCVSLRGVMTWDGDRPEIFEHSIQYKAYRTTDNPIKYERYPNHLNCIRSSIAKRFKFPNSFHGEDTDWATQIYNSGLLQTETYVSETLYHYRYVTSK
jgi:glycosyltransferase involved in cell wall biosynthesis